MINNGQEDIRLRRDQNTLRIVGAGTIVFGVWSCVKAFGVLFFKRQEIINEILEDAGKTDIQLSEDLEGKMFTVLLIMVLIVLLADLAARLFVGLSAISESRGRRRGILYIAVTCIMISTSFTTIISVISGSVNKSAAESVSLMHDSVVSTVLIELTSMVMLTEMVVASVRTKRFRQRTERTERETKDAA